MATFAPTTAKRFGPAPLATVAAEMEAYLESLTSLMTLYKVEFIECHRDNQVMGVIVHEQPLLPMLVAVVVQAAPTLVQS